MHIVLKANASKATGFGHYKRSMILAEAFLEQNFKVTFISNYSPDCLKISPKIVYKYVENDYEVEPNIKPDIFIIDDYNLHLDYENFIRNIFSCRLFCIDDFKNRPHNCDFFLNQNMGFKINDYKNLTPNTCKFYIGPDYALVNSVIRKSRPKLFSPKKRVDNILINFGGSDPYRLSIKFAEFLSDLNFTGQISIVLGHSYNDQIALFKKSKSFSDKIRIYGFIDFLPLLNSVDLIIGASGSSIWERCCLGIPMILVTLGEDQLLVAKALEQNSAAFYSGHYNDQNLEEKFKTLFISVKDNEDLRNHVARKCFSLCDGLGAKRIVKDIYENN